MGFRQDGFMPMFFSSAIFLAVRISVSHKNKQQKSLKEV
jgi:hypothetical protein